MFASLLLHWHLVLVVQVGDSSLSKVTSLGGTNVSVSLQNVEKSTKQLSGRLQTTG